MMQNRPRITTALGAIATCAFMIAATASAASASGNGDGEVIIETHLHEANLSSKLT